MGSLAFVSSENSLFSLQGQSLGRVDQVQGDGSVRALFLDHNAMIFIPLDARAIVESIDMCLSVLAIAWTMKNA